MTCTMFVPFNIVEKNNPYVINSKNGGIQKLLCSKHNSNFWAPDIPTNIVQYCLKFIKFMKFQYFLCYL